jgi:hypothetical protein
MAGRALQVDVKPVFLPGRGKFVRYLSEVARSFDRVHARDDIDAALKVLVDELRDMERRCVRDSGRTSQRSSLLVPALSYRSRWGCADGGVTFQSVWGRTRDEPKKRGNPRGSDGTRVLPCHYSGSSTMGRPDWCSR